MGEVHFANPLGHWLAPLLLTLRSVGFFEWYVYMPAMTLVSFPLYRFMARRLDTVPAFRASSAWHQRVRRSACYAASFLLPNVLAVALKTLIVEEMDYVAPVWYAPLVSPLHFYIASVTGAYLWMIGRTRRTWADWACAGHIQLGLVGGYAVAGYRLLNEQWSWLDPTTAIGGLIIGVVSLGYNWDLVWRLRLSGAAHDSAA
ncbi:MAG: hypothetical protein ABL971_09715 [Vicinamibacterales bacterium]